MTCNRPCDRRAFRFWTANLSRKGWSVRTITALGITLAVVWSVILPAGAGTLGPTPPANPYLGPMGNATVHGDAESSNSTVNHGPGTGVVTALYTPLDEACPTILEGSDGYPQALCTTYSRIPTVNLLDPSTGSSLASLSLTQGSLLGGVYAYIDNNDQLVVLDGSDSLLRIGHNQDGPGGTWQLFIASSTPVGSAVWGHCGQPGCDYADSVMPDNKGRVWFSTDGGAVGVIDPTTGVANSITMPAGEYIENSISTAPEGTAVVTTHALYLVTAGKNDLPRIVWRRTYDRGPGRKPGQLSWGSGSTPTFFGPTDGTDYIAITDNAVPMENLLVYRTTDGAQLCSVPAINGTENSPIGSGNSVFIASTYGYPYPALPPHAGPSVPTSARFSGGMTRINVNHNGCAVKWTNTVRSAAEPRLSITDGYLYTTVRIRDPGTHGAGDGYAYTVIDAATGDVLSQQVLGSGETYNPLQTAGTIDPTQVQYQGVFNGLFRISS